MTNGGSDAGVSGMERDVAYLMEHDVLPPKPPTCPHCGAVVRYEGRPACDSMPFDPAPFSQPKDTGNE